MAWIIRILDTIEEMIQVEELQRLVWPGSEAEIVPAHLLITVAHNGGLIIGAYPQPDSHSDPTADEITENPSSQVHPGQLLGCVFGFPGLEETSQGLKLKHCSHILGVAPQVRDKGLGFALKRAQWQMVRRQGVERVTWTYDPLLSRNAHLNLTRLGAVCNTYLQNLYGAMQDDNNIGLPSDRFQVDWWVNSRRVVTRLSRQRRVSLDLAHFLSAGVPIINPTRLDERGFPRPVSTDLSSGLPEPGNFEKQSIVLVEIPADFQSLKSSNLELGLEWRMHTRMLFQSLFERGYLVTDFIFLPGTSPRSFYVLSDGDHTL